MSVDFKRIARMLARRKTVMALCILTVLATATATLEVVPEEYETAATLRIQEGPRLANQIENVVGSMRESAGRRNEDWMDELVGRVRSRPFLMRVARVLRLDEAPGVLSQAQKTIDKGSDLSLEQVAGRIAARRLRRKIRFASQGSGIYRIVVTDTDPREAQLLAKWVSVLFVDESIQSQLEQLRMTRDFGLEQLKIYEGRLERSEQALAQYKRSQIEQSLARALVGERNVEVAEALYERVIEEVELSRMRVSPFLRSLSETQVEIARRDVLTDPEVLSQFSVLSAALKEELEDRLGGRIPKAGEWPPGGDYLAARRALFQLIGRHVASSQSDAGPESGEALARFVFATLDHRAHAALADVLGQAIAEFKTQAQSQPGGEMELARLEAEVALNRDLLDSFRKHLVASDISQAMETTDLGLRVEVLDPPQVPLAPARPDRSGILLGAVVVGMLLALVIAIATELMDPTLRSLAAFQRIFDGPVLGTAPLLASASDRPHRGRRTWVPAALIGVVLLGVLFFLAKPALFPGDDDVGKSSQSFDSGELRLP